MLPVGTTLASGPRVAVKLAAFAILSIAAAPAHAQTLVHFGDTLSAPGVYVLAGNQTGSGQVGVEIESDDVTLLLLRFTLRGDGNDPGIVSFGNDNVTIYGGRVTNCRAGIVLESGKGCTVKDTRIDHCLSAGLILRGMDESFFLRLRCDQNGGNGVDVEGGLGSRLVSILAHDNDLNGIVLGGISGLAGVPSDEAEGNTVRLCWASYNKLDGIRIQLTSDHEVARNQCVGNGAAGIHLGLPVSVDPTVAPPPPGTRDNLVTRNWCVFNQNGIVVGSIAQSNTLTNNTALANLAHDMIDDSNSPPCANTWFLNSFLTKDGDGAACIF